MKSHLLLKASCVFIIIYLILPVICVCSASLFSGASNILQYVGYEDTLSRSVGKSVSIHFKSRKMLGNGVCTNRDISISQSKSSSTGIPQYVVEIANTCVSGCAPSHIHLHCGWFASARIVNPNTFKRLSYDDCLVNGGRSLRSSQIIRFTYSNSFMYPLSFKSARFC